MAMRGYSTGFTWVFGIISLFGLGLLYIVFNQVLTVHVVPTIIGMVNVSTIDATTRAEVISGITKYMAFFNVLPFIIMGAVVIYMFLAAVRREREEF